MSGEPLIPLSGELPCKSCGCILPVGAFRRLVGGEPTLPRYHHSCKPCEKRQAKEAKDIEEQKKVFFSFIRDVNKPEHNVPHIAELAGAVLEKFGGVDGLATELKDFDRDIKADDKRKGSATHLNLYKMIMKLVTSATEHRDTVNAQEMTDEELAAALMAHLEKHTKGQISAIWQQLPKPQPAEDFLTDDTSDLYDPAEESLEDK